MADVGRQSDQAAAARVSKEVQIRAVRLASGFFESRDADLDTAGFHTEYYADVKGLTDHEATVIVGFRLADHREGAGHSPSGDDSPDEANPPLSVFAEFELTYSLNNPVDSDDAEPFAWLNGVYNAWPFWRALVHMMLPQMGLPPLVVPVFRIPRPTPPKKSRRPAAEVGSTTAGSKREPARQRDESASPEKVPKPKSTPPAAKRPRPQR